MSIFYSERAESKFKFNPEKGFFYIHDDGTEHKVTEVRIIANGIKDLCLTNHYKINQISKTLENERLYIFKGDVLMVLFDPPIKEKFSTLFLDIGSDIKRLTRLAKAMANWSKRGKIGKDYDMYAGGDYIV